MLGAPHRADGIRRRDVGREQLGGTGVSSRVVRSAGGASGGARRVGGPFFQHVLNETRHRPVRLQDRVHIIT